MAATATKPGQGELSGMPKATGSQKAALEYLKRSLNIIELEEEQDTSRASIMKLMKKEKRDVIKVRCPDTNKLKEFKIDDRDPILRVKKIAEKVGKEN